MGGGHVFSLKTLLLVFPYNLYIFDTIRLGSIFIPSYIPNGLIMNHHFKEVSVYYFLMDTGLLISSVNII